MPADSSDHAAGPLREHLESRLTELRQDFDAGQQRLGRLDLEAAQLRETMLRLSGAIQVLEEVLHADPSHEVVDGVATKLH